MKELKLKAYDLENTYPKEIKTVEDIKKVISVLVNEVMDDEDRETMLKDLNDIEISLNGRLKRSLGRCVGRFNNKTKTYKTLKLDFNKDYILYEENNNHKIDTIIHEVMHMLTNIQYNGFTGHDENWKNNCKKYGCRPSAISTPTTYKLVMEENGTYKYALICNCCGRTIERKKKLTKNYIDKVNNHYWYHNQCGSNDLSIVKL